MSPAVAWVWMSCDATSTSLAVIEIESTPGKGQRHHHSRLPDAGDTYGQTIRIGKETYIVPLVSIVESIQIQESMLTTPWWDMVYIHPAEEHRRSCACMRCLVLRTTTPSGPTDGIPGGRREGEPWWGCLWTTSWASRWSSNRLKPTTERSRVSGATILVIQWRSS